MLLAPGELVAHSQDAPLFRVGYSLVVVAPLIRFYKAPNGGFALNEIMKIQVSFNIALARNLLVALRTDPVFAGFAGGGGFCLFCNKPAMELRGKV